MRCYIVDAFADKVFEGNPACVCVMEHWLPEELMQQIAMENNLSETAFAVKEDKDYRLRWFTPGGEIDLCGHATLAAAYIVMQFVEPGKDRVCFRTISGDLTVIKKQELYEMDFPVFMLRPVDVTDQMAEVIGVRPVEAWLGRDLVCILDYEEQVNQAVIDMQKAQALDGLLLHITAKGTAYDCVTRSFAPKLGVNEDPVCGSGHCHVAPLWAKKQNIDMLVARQASKRGGTLYCSINGDRMKMSGKAVLYATAELHIGQKA